MFRSMEIFTTKIFFCNILSNLSTNHILKSEITSCTCRTLNPCDWSGLWIWIKLLLTWHFRKMFLQLQPSLHSFHILLKTFKCPSIGLVYFQFLVRFTMEKINFSRHVCDTNNNNKRKKNRLLLIDICSYFGGLDKQKTAKVGSGWPWLWIYSKILSVVYCACNLCENRLVEWCILQFNTKSMSYFPQE